MARDYYSVLGVKKDADQKQIKTAFRKLARKHHPDVNPGDKSAEERFKEINAAHDVLSDPKKRAKYDRYGRGMVGIAYVGTLDEGEAPSTGSEMLEVGLFAPDNLPELAFSSHRRAIGDWARTLADPSNA